MSLLLFFGHTPTIEKTKGPLPELLLQSLVTPLGEVEHGALIQVTSVPWLALALELERDPDALFRFSKHPRVFEEFIAGAYDLAGFDDVVLTPRSGDGGRDVIATKRGYYSIKILDQAKAYSPQHLVTADDVRAMLGTLNAFADSSKGVITTTSDFAPGVKSARELQQFMPHRLDLKNGTDLRGWIEELRKPKS